MRVVRFTNLASFLFLASDPVAALSEPATLVECANISDDQKRLACFDQIAAGLRASKEDKPVKEVDKGERPVGVSAPALPASDSTARSLLDEHWELERESKRGVLKFRPHRPNYLIATYSTSPNSAPYLPFQRLVSSSATLSHMELAFQLSFKMKLAENALGKPVDLWFGYTQNSFWQAINREASSPFRESNYQPELMAVFPLKFNLLGLHARFINLGLVHQSNGQASTLSRSWNRVYAQLGMEKDDVTLVGRWWRRLKESASEDDNPDIVDYMGRGDLSVTYRWRGQEFSLLTRYNFQTHKGAAQLGWTFPIAGQLKGYVQLFSGYGQSLIDYNHSQKVLGLGILVSY